MWMPNANEPENFVDGPTIETFDPDDGVFLLEDAVELKPNAIFVVRVPGGYAWNIHHNIINDCARIVMLDVFGEPTSVFSDNVLN